MQKNTYTIMFGLLLLILAMTAMQLTNAQTTDPSVSLQAANVAINQAYTNVQALENTGQNVSQLIARLSTAGDLLSQAENSYKSGDLTNVASKADGAALTAAQVNSDATAILRTTNGSQNSLLTTIALSAIGIAVIILILALVWRRLKRNYYKKILSLKPEVTEVAA
jgi:hypothetical protein